MRSLIRLYGEISDQYDVLMALLESGMDQMTQTEFEEVCNRIKKKLDSLSLVCLRALDKNASLSPKQKQALYADIVNLREELEHV